MKKISKKSPIFSVVIDNFNYGRYLEEAVESVLNQTFPQEEIEIIFVDDGSTDDSSERVKKYEGRIKCLFKENGGQASALSYGIANAEGRIISFLDSDDYWHPRKLECVFEEFERAESLDFVYHYLSVVDNDHRIIDRYVFPPPVSGDKTGSGAAYLRRYLGGDLPFFSPTSGLAVKADCLRKVVPIPDEFRIAADIYLHYTLPFYVRQLSLIRKPLGYYRIHTENAYGGHSLTVGKVSEAIRITSLLGAHVREHSRKLGQRDALIAARLESVKYGYEVLLHNYRGAQISAARMALSFDKFLPGDSLSYRLMRRMVLLVSAMIPASLHLWLQRRFRSLLYWRQHDRGWDRS